MLDDAVDGSEAQSGAFAALLGGEERLEDARRNVLGDAESGVADGQHDVVAGRHGCVFVFDEDVAGFEQKLASARHGVAGVGGEVHEHLLELFGVGLNGPEIGRQLDPDDNVLADEAGKHGHGTFDDAIEIGGEQLLRLTAAEGEQLTG